MNKPNKKNKIIFILIAIVMSIFTCSAYVNSNNKTEYQNLDKDVMIEKTTKTELQINIALLSYIEEPKISKQSEVPPNESEPPEEIIEPILPYSEDELHALALTLSGECYDFEEQDKRNVAWVICNRVDDGRFGGDDIINVVSSKKFGIQFSGYWHQNRPISDNDYAIADEVLTTWYNREEPIHNYLYFSSGKGTTNIFR